MGLTNVLDRQRQRALSESRRSTSTAEADSVEREIAFHRLVDRQLDRCYRLAAVVLGTTGPDCPGGDPVAFHASLAATV